MSSRYLVTMEHLSSLHQYVDASSEDEAIQKATAQENPFAWSAGKVSKSYSVKERPVEGWDWEKTE